MYRSCRKTWFVLSFFAMLVTTVVGQAPVQEHPASNALAPEDAKEIIHRALEVDQRNLVLARNYTYQEKRDTRAFDKHGSTKHKENETYDFTILYGEPYSRLIQKNDKSLSEKDEKKGQEKL